MGVSPRDPLHDGVITTSFARFVAGAGAALMLWVYRKVAVDAARRMRRSWPAALALVVYPLLLIPAGFLTAQLGIIGGFLMGFLVAACWSSYLELIAQAVEGARFRLDWDEFKRSFAARFWDVVSVMFAFWLISLLAAPLMSGSHGRAVSAIFGFAVAFFFNAVPELLYLGNSRSFALLIDSARFMMDHAVVWLLPNILFAALALWAGGGLVIQHPVEVLILFGNTFSSPDGVAQLFFGLPIWAWPIALFAIHYLMVFRGLLFQELSSGAANPRLRAFRARMGR